MSMSLGDRKIGYQLLKHLKTLKGQEGIPQEHLDSAYKSISALYEVDLSSVEDFLALNYFDATLPQIFEAGVAAVHAQHYEEGLAEAEANPRFAPFMETITKKNYFEHVEKGSLEDYQRRAKVLAKFKEKLANPIIFGSKTPIGLANSSVSDSNSSASTSPVTKIGTGSSPYFSSTPVTSPDKSVSSIISEGSSVLSQSPSASGES